MNVYPNSNISALTDPSHPVYKAVESEFDHWFDAQPGYRQDPYQGWGEDEPPVQNKSGAIFDAIEAMIDEANETGSPVKISAFDVYALFQ